jgi:hypothetical protein
VQLRWHRKPDLQVALGFLLLMLAVLTVSLGLPSLEQRCTGACEGKGMKGQLTARFSATQTAGTGGRGAEKCQCV